MSGHAAWLTLALLGGYHGLNPAMGWLFAVALGMQEGRAAAVLRALPPIAVGHAASIATVIVLVGAAQVAVAPAALRAVGATILLAFALFILARAATLRADMPGARTYFERALEVAREPRIVAWSHIYLGRILDLQENRVGALLHYRAALSAGDTTPDTRAAAERGIEKPYAPVRR